MALVAILNDCHLIFRNFTPPFPVHSSTGSNLDRVNFVPDEVATEEWEDEPLLRAPPSAHHPRPRLQGTAGEGDALGAPTVTVTAPLAASPPADDHMVAALGGAFCARGVLLVWFPNRAKKKGGVGGRTSYNY